MNDAGLSKLRKTFKYSGDDDSGDPGPAEGLDEQGSSICLENEYYRQASLTN